MLKKGVRQPVSPCGAVPIQPFDLAKKESDTIFPHPATLASRFLIIILLTVALYGQAGDGQKVTISVLASTDMHGNLYPIDYFTDRPAARGLAMLATLIRQARSENPNSMLVDCGDTIQGSSLESVYQ